MADAALIQQAAINALEEPRKGEISDWIRCYHLGFNKGPSPTSSRSHLSCAFPKAGFFLPMVRGKGHESLLRLQWSSSTETGQSQRNGIVQVVGFASCYVLYYQCSGVTASGTLYNNSLAREFDACEAWNHCCF
jgi:hypothetical protein